jgi:FtsP/CotA-like multicopper oxidase with cupredoxin domain
MRIDPLKLLKPAATAAILLIAPGLAAQTVTCPPLNQELIRVPELISDKGKLRGTIVVSAEQERITFRVPASAPSPTSTSQCFPQWVRIIRGVDAVPAPPATEPNTYPDSLPGPTLRMRVGELVELTMLNQIDVGPFANSIDRGEASPQGGCDQTSIYPGPGPDADTYPDCFHGSSTFNMHFHGTHTNPGSTGDNVFIEVRPSLRTKDEANKPLVTAETVKKPFGEFFARCEAMLKPTNPLSQWPRTWKDFPAEWTTEQKRLLKLYDANPRIGRKLWPVDAKQIALQQWPQYYIGAYPYCFRIPEYTGTTWPPAGGALNAVHASGAGSAEHDVNESSRPLIMGQSPGTHWYHAHKHGSTALNVANGMTGAFIIEGKYDDDLNAYYGTGWTRKQPVMVINQIGMASNLERGGGGTGQGPDKGPDFSVNGRLKPIVTMYPGQVMMFRIVNTSGRAGVFFNAPLANTFSWRQLAQDGVQFADANYQAALNQSFLLMAGNRADLLVKAPLTTGSYPVYVQNMVDPRDLIGTGAAAVITLMTINVTGSGTEMSFIPHAPSFPPFLTDITTAEVKGTKTITFESDGAPGGFPPTAVQHKIDGKKFDGEVGEVVLLNNVEEWKVVNRSFKAVVSHPFHIHINPFQVTEVFDPNATVPNPTGVAGSTTLPQYVFTQAEKVLPSQCVIDPANPDTWHPCDTTVGKNLIWWDVFPIPSGRQVTDANKKVIANIPGYFRMRSRFVDYYGYYVIHCHILAHEDRGMMTIVEVAPLQSPYSHH